MDLDEMIQKKQETVNTMNYKGRDTMREGKLVRDNIPDIIRADGKTPVTRILDQEEYLNELDRTLQEEVAEYQADKFLEELADILEVLSAICKARGYSRKDLLKVRDEKRRKRGGFEKRIYWSGNE
ncbi:nucleoside triphosphate pyrophosphohydrolase [Sellimonas sp.]|uniref:nucleoside triphosphate pyrophosphohydrolase n=1 Tax=Sellimonas sp. TaxID=2021466 RepID=UPI002ED48446